MGSKTQKFQQLLYRYLPVLLLLVYTWLRAAAMLARVTDPDSGLFETFAYHMHEGKVLYADIWDHKPPLIFWLNLIFLNLFDISEDGISYGSLIFCLIQTLVFYALALKLMGNRLSAFLATAAFITAYYSVFVFGSGNYTEQYAVLCTSAGLWFFISFLEDRKSAYVWVSGILFGISIWFKEPFVFSAAPYFIFLFYRAIRNKKHFREFIQFTLAFLIPALLVANLIVLTGGKEGYIEHLVHSRLYAKSSNTEPLWVKLADNRLGFFPVIPLKIWITIPIYLIALGYLIRRIKSRTIFLLIAAQQLFDYLGTGMSGNRFFHYYMQTAPLTWLIILSGIAIFSIDFNKLPAIGKQIPLILTLIFVIIKFELWKGVRMSPEKDFPDPISNFLKRNVYYTPRPVALVSKDIGFYLLRVEGISETRYVVPYAYHWIKIPGQKKHSQMTADSARFADWQPEYVIRSEHYAEIFEDCGLDSVIQADYFEVAKTQLFPDKAAYLLKKRVKSEE